MVLAMASSAKLVQYGEQRPMLYHKTETVGADGKQNNVSKSCVGQLWLIRIRFIQPDWRVSVGAVAEQFALKVDLK